MQVGGLCTHSFTTYCCLRVSVYSVYGQSNLTCPSEGQGKKKSDSGSGSVLQWFFAGIVKSPAALLFS